MAARAFRRIAPALLLAFASPLASQGTATPIKVSGPVTPGALLILSPPAGTVRLLADGVEVPAAPDGRYLVGLHRDRTLPLKVEALAGGGKSTSLSLPLTPREWRIQRLPALGTTDTPAPEWQARRNAEVARLKAAKAAAATDQASAFGWSQPFLRPAGGRITGVYGSQRSYGGLERPPHWGLDIANATGTPVRAPAEGIVRLAEGPFLLEGNVVLIDHGAGVVTSYMHLSEHLVRAGDRVKQGQPIGRIGTTGRSTGPHLHWGLSLLRPGPARGEVIELRLDPRLMLSSG